MVFWAERSAWHAIHPQAMKIHPLDNGTSFLLRPKGSEMTTNPSASSLEELTASLEEYQRRLNDAEALYCSFKPKPTKYHQSMPDRQEVTAARIEMENLTAIVNSLKSEIEVAKKHSSASAEAADAPEKAKTAAKVRQAYQKEVDRLKERIAMVEQRSAGLRQTNAEYFSGLDEREKEARLSYAAAVSNGDSEAIEAAETVLSDVSQARMQAQQQATFNGNLIAALETEAAQLHTQLAAANAAVHEAFVAQCAAIEVMISEEWNRAVDNLMGLAAKVTAIRAARGGASTLLDGLSVPRLGALRGSALRISEVRNRAASLTVEKLLG